MPKFPDFESMQNDPPPEKDELLEMIGTFDQALLMLYVRHNYQAFYDERYDAVLRLDPRPKEEWTFDFDTFMEKDDEEELKSMCSKQSINFIIDMCVAVTDLVDKQGDDLDALVADLGELTVAFDGAMADAKLQHVQDVFEHWSGDAGSAIRRNYSDHFTKSTQTHAEMARALRNAAKLDSLIMMKLRHHLDGLIRDVGVALDNGPAAVKVDVSPIVGWLTVIGVITSFPGGPGVMSLVGWAGATVQTLLTKLPLEEQEGPTMDSTDPDELREQVLAAFVQVADVVRAERERLAEELIGSFGQVEKLLGDDDPARSSRVVPNPNGVDGIEL